MNKQMKQWRWTPVVLGLAFALAAASCGGSSGDGATDQSDDAVDAASDAGAADDATDDSSDSGDPSDSDENANGSDAGASDSDDRGTLVLDDETISLSSSRCYLQEQDAAAGGGKILFVAQGFGTNAAGEELMVDVSRYDEDSQFTGDDITVDIGAPGSAVSWHVTADLGTVQIDGQTLRADGLTLTNWDDNSEAPGSIEIRC